MFSCNVLVSSNFVRYTTWWEFCGETFKQKIAFLNQEEPLGQYEEVDIWDQKAQVWLLQLLTVYIEEILLSNYFKCLLCSEKKDRHGEFILLHLTV